MPLTGRRCTRPISKNFGPQDQQSEAPEALFVYGSLRFPAVLRTLLDRVPASTAALAPGWRAVEIPDAVFPALVEGNDTAEGMLLHGLTPDEWQVLDAFEDPLYELLELALTGDRRGWAYVCTDPDSVSTTSWDPSLFEAQHLDAYVQNCTAWREKYEARQRRG